ncbi:MAG TPA: hypothetical protein VJ793_11600 [Anaerolineae bacterium]|nr:hypothetical protein [Anaerolineae bacterium]
MSDPSIRAGVATRVWSPGVVWARVSPLILAGLAYILLVCFAYTPIIASLSSAIPGTSQYEDFAIFHWNLWWFQHAIFRLGQDPFFTNYVFFPHTINLAYHTFTPFLDIIGLPVYAALGATAAINVLIVGSLAFSGLAMFAFLHHHKVPAGLAFVGGALFAFTPFTTARVSFVHLNTLPIGWLPLGLLTWDHLVERRTLGAAVVLSGVLYAAFMTDQQFGVWLALLLTPYALFRLVRSGERTRRRTVLLGAFAAIVLIGFMLIAPLPQLLAGRNVEYPTTPLPHPVLQSRYSLHLDDVIAWPPRYLNSERVTLGVLLPVGAAIGLVRGRRAAGRVFWLVMGAAFLVLAFGPTFEPLNLPLPYQLFHRLTGGLYRVPARFIILTVFALIVFAVTSLRSDYQRLGRAARWACVVGALLWLGVENRWYEPFPTFHMPDYRIYHAIGADPDVYLLLEVPVGPHNTGDRIFGHGGVLQYFAWIHHKRLINGAISRVSTDLTEWYRQWPLLAALAEEGPLPDLALARREFQHLSDKWDIRYVLLHRDMLTPDVATWAAGLFNTQASWCLVDEEGALLAYRRTDTPCRLTERLRLPPASRGTLSLGDGSDERYLGPGWYYAENVGGPQARWTGREPAATLRVALTRRDYRVSLRAASYVPDQIVTVYANGRRVAALSIGEGWGEYTFDLPAESISADSLLTLMFVHRRAQSPRERIGSQSDDRRPLAVAYDSITFTPEVP